MAMSWQISVPNDSVNVSFTSGATAMFAFKSLLLANGGTIRESSDGTTFGLSDNISHAGSGAGGMANNYAYFVIAIGVMDIGFQRGTTSRDWRSKISVPGFVNTEGGYVAGTATAMPIVTDQQHLAGTDVPAFVQKFSPDGTTGYCHMGMDNAPPHHFWFASLNNCKIIFDELTGYSASDTWPYVVTALEVQGWNIGAFADPTYAVCSYYRRAAGPGTEAFVRWPALAYGDLSSATLIGSGCRDPDTGLDWSLPMMFARRSALGSPGKKGVSVHMRLKGNFNNTRSISDDTTGRRWTVFDDVYLLTPPGVVLFLM